MTPPAPKVYTVGVRRLHPRPSRLPPLAWGCLLSLWSATAAAQSLPTVRAEQRPVLPVDAPSGEVRLEVGVGEDGVIRSVSVLSASDPALVEPAIEAMSGFLFTPARDAEGVPVPATVLYTMQLTPGPPPGERVQGRLRQAGDRAPLAGGRVELRCGGAVARRGVSDAAGRFTVWAEQPAACTLLAEAPGYTVAVVEVDVEAGEVLDLTIYLRERDEQGAEVVDVVTERDAPEVLERRMSADDLRYLPGSAGDVVRSVQNLPGVARSPFSLGALIVRGADPESSGYSIDGMDVPLVFHFGGLSTVINPELVDEALLMPGGWGVRYGRRLGARLELRTRLELPERHRGFVSLDLFQVAAFAAVRASARTGVTLSVRRSYIDAVLSPVLSNSQLAVRAPRYYDAQARLVHLMPGGGSIDALLMISDDKFATLDEDSAGEQEQQLGFETTFQKLQVQWRAPARDGWRHTFSLSAGPDRQGLSVRAEESAFERRFSVLLRDEHVHESDAGTSWRLGFDLLAGTWQFQYQIGFFGPPEAGRTAVFAPAVYVEPSWRVGPVRWTAGLRGDLLRYGTAYDAWSFDPRAAVSIEAGPTTTLSAAFGKYTQAPPPRQVLASGDGTETLRAPWAVQSMLTLDQRFPEGVSLQLSAYYHHTFDMVAGREERFRFFVTPPPSGPLDSYPYGNEGRARSFGVELMLRWQSERAMFWFSGTFGRSERYARLTETWGLFAYDQPYLMQALSSVKLPRRWRIGARLRVGAGNPYTAIEQRVLDLDTRRFVPVFGELNDARLPPFVSLDLRIDKTWVFDRWSFSLYLDLQNATNQRNLELMTWRWDYAVEEGIRGLPIVPAFGLRGDW